MKALVYSLLLLLLTSCGYRTLEGRVKPVYFSADSSVFADTLSPVQTLFYQNVMRLGQPCLESVDLQQAETVSVFIAKPTIFQKQYDHSDFLVYPGEHIFISGTDEPTFSTLHQNKVRDGELLVLKIFPGLEKRPEVPRMLDYTFKTILDSEKSLKSQIVTAERVSQLLFDSLSTAYHVSKKFRRLTKDYIHNRYDGIVLATYVTYRDTLLAHDVYLNKVRALLPEVNGLTKTSQFNLNLEWYTNGIYTWLFPNNGIRNMVTQQDGFKACFDSVVTNFTGPARDYLLSRIMYRAYTQGVEIPPGYRKLYRHYSMNKGYRKIIARAARRMRNSQSDISVFPNELLMADGKTRVRWEDVLAQYKGEYVLVDLWASWCVPCIEEMPVFEELRQRYPVDKVTFLSVSVDANVQAWRTRLNQLRGDSLTNYLLLNPAATALTKQIGLTTIPRYLLYDREGKIINIDVPAPSDPELGEMLDKLLLK